MSPTYSRLSQVVPSPKITTIDGITLPKTQYLLLAHCSHQFITIRKHHTTKTKLTKLTFITPQLPADESGTLTIQCQRLHASMFDQTLRNIYTLFLLDGRHRFFIQSTPYEVITHHHDDELTVHLAALKVATPTPPPTHPTQRVPLSNAQHYDISHPIEGSSSTNSLRFNEWIFLLPGSYKITVNGTHRILHLTAGQTHTITLGSLLVATPPAINLKALAIATGQPYAFTLITHTTQHQLYPNTHYFLLDGEYHLALGASTQSTKITIKPQHTTHRVLHALTVHNPCKPHSLCSQQVELSLFQPNHTSPMIRTQSDLPVFFSGTELALTTHQSFGFKTALNLTPPDPTHPTHFTLTLGQVNFNPVVVYDPAKKTELVRIEDPTYQPLHFHQSTELWPLGQIGQSEDIQNQPQISAPPTQMTTAYLLPGKYQLVSYESVKHQQGFTKQRRELQHFVVGPGQTLQLDYTVLHPPPQAPP